MMRDYSAIVPRQNINVSALRSNIDSIRKLTRNSPFLVMVKGNAYGMGLKGIAKSLWDLGITMFGVQTIDEAQQVREVVKKATIVNFQPLSPDVFSLYQTATITPVITKKEDIDLLCSNYNGKPITAWLKLDTGVGRWGLNNKEAMELASNFVFCKNVRISVIATTLPETTASDRRAIQYLTQIRQQFKKKGVSIPQTSYASSHGILTYSNLRMSIIRPGISVYGEYPDEKTKQEQRIQLTPVSTLACGIAQIRVLKPNQRILYKEAFVVRKPMTAATVPIGYAQGYPPILARKADVLVEGIRCRILGITMGAMVIDISNVPAPFIGQEVVLMGAQKGQAISLSELSRLSGLSTYQILTGLSSSVKRVYI